MTIGVVGLWHLGEIVSACLADLGHIVFGIDTNQKTVDALNQGTPPLHEPGLKELLAKHRGDSSLLFSSSFADLGTCDAVFLTYDTPVSDTDEPDTSILFSAVKSMAPHLRADTLFVVMSQVPVGTTQALLETMKETNPSYRGETVYFPENLQLGKAVPCFLRPDRLVIGADIASARERMEKIIAPIPAPRHVTNIATAEMSKHALNAFLATSLSFIYNIADLCEATGADVTEVAAALRSDSRIGPAAYLDASLGFSGGTLMRDLRSLTRLSQETARPIPVITGALTTNLERRPHVADRLEQLLGVPLSGAKIGILGVTYKPGTATLRRSLGLEVMDILGARGADVVAYDPMARQEEFFALTGKQLSTDPYSMAQECRALLLVTAWPELRDLDFARLKQGMKAPYIFFDTRNFLKEKESAITAGGLKYVGLGRAKEQCD